ncbi:hypothetical protein DF3PB_4120007 [uncultured Defluviicoccus sp.]|uniref:Uncharacterized protein n=1 Tax=metagenome TaxID=256318 RepID=A0A380TGP5_9ZZZZ|nr:hypothetical protein DF3PB_4120007 [uncultured Defluviicoccus sp.]
MLKVLDKKAPKDKGILYQNPQLLRREREGTFPRRFYLDENRAVAGARDRRVAPGAGRPSGCGTHSRQRQAAVTDLAAHIEAVTRRLLGEPNRALSSSTEWR